MSSKLRLSYDPLWKLLIDKKMNKSQLAILTGLSPATIAKLGRGDSVRTEAILRICEALDCQPGDIIEATPAIPASKESHK